MKRATMILLSLCMLLIAPYAQASNCAMCGGTGYLTMPVFGTNELVKVNCTACGGSAAATDAVTAAPVPAQPIDALQLTDPGDFAKGSDECTYAEKGFAVFFCKSGYDIKGYIDDLTVSTGLEVTREFSFYGGNVIYYQLTHPHLDGLLYQETCHATVFFTKNGTVSLAVPADGNVRLPARAGVALPDPGPFAYGNDEVKGRNINGITYYCEDGYDIEGYIDLLRYDYGFDVEAVDRGEDGVGVWYGLYNMDIDATTFSNRKEKIQVEISYNYFDNRRLGISLPYEGSIIQLPLRGEGHYVSYAEDHLPELPSNTGSEVVRGTNLCSYTFAQPYDPLPYVIDLIEEGFVINGITQSEEVTTYYMLKPGYHVKRIYYDTAHVSVTYDEAAQKLTLEKAANSLSMPKSGQPTQAPEQTPTPTPSAGGSSSGEWCIACGNSGNCSGCGGNKKVRKHVAGTTDWIYQTCLTCLGSGDCKTCGGDGWR